MAKKIKEREAIMKLFLFPSNYYLEGLYKTVKGWRVRMTLSGKVYSQTFETIDPLAAFQLAVEFRDVLLVNAWYDNTTGYRYISLTTKNKMPHISVKLNKRTKIYSVSRYGYKKAMEMAITDLNGVYNYPLLPTLMLEKGYRHILNRYGNDIYMDILRIDTPKDEHAPTAYANMTIARRLVESNILWCDMYGGIYVVNTSGGLTAITGTTDAGEIIMSDLPEVNCRQINDSVIFGRYIFRKIVPDFVVSLQTGSNYARVKMTDEFNYMLG